MAETVGISLFGKGTETAASAAIEYLRREGPVTVTVLASWSKDQCYFLALEFHNLTGHGAYLEEIWVSEPAKNIDIDFAAKATREDSFGTSEEVKWLASAGYFPKYISAQGTTKFAVRMKDDQAKTLSSATVAGLSYKFTVVGGGYVETPPKKSIKVARVRLRTAGPAFSG
jgi:hypothetical protein